MCKTPRAFLELGDADSLREGAPVAARERRPRLGASLARCFDRSHGNSGKDHRRQEIVWDYLVEQFANGNRAILGAMLESNLHEGNQKLATDLSTLKHGVSITDACIGWEKTEEILMRAHERIGRGQLAATH